MNLPAPWTVTPGPGPLVALAIHHGHDLRPEVAARCGVAEADRRREEDPFTGGWAAAADAGVVVHRSRFEIDLNRPRADAVYLGPEQAWGLTPWEESPSAGVLARSRTLYDDFYRELETLLRPKLAIHGRVVVLDLHSYNHRRGGPGAVPAPPVDNPDVNVGTGSLNRPPWAGLIDGFMADLRAFPFPGGPLDVRENVRFRGGELSRWVHRRFPGRAGCLALEFKKIFMDEWTGRADPQRCGAVGRALAAAVPGLRRQLGRMPLQSRSRLPILPPPAS